MSVEAPLGAAPQGGAFEIPSAATIVEPAHKRRRTRARPLIERATLGALAAILLLGLLLCIAGTHTVQLLPQSIQLALPTSFAGPFDHIGFRLPQGGVLSAVILMMLAYLFVVWYAEHVPARTMIWAVALLNAIVLLGPPLFSTDVFSYQAYARMFAVYHTNPYTHGPSVMQLDPLYNYIGAKWIATPSVYGPLFTFLSSAFASSSIAFSEFAFKLIAAAASGGTLYLIWRSAERRGLNPVRSIALFGLSPLITVGGVGGGHNDLLMLMLTTGGIYAVLSRHERVAGGLMTAGAAIKLTGGLVFPFALLAGPGLDAPRRRHAFLIGAAAVTAVLAVASWLFFGVGILDLKDTLQHVQDEGTWQSIPGFMFSVFGISVPAVVRTVVAIGCVGCVLWLLHRVWKGRMDWIDGAGWATVAVLVTAWSLLPWYAAWLMPLVALCSSRRLWYAGMAINVVAGTLMVALCFPHGLSL